jgi:hypothetical protein
VNALLDYRFGWRWLLPSPANRRTCLLGFDAEESDFLKSVLPATSFSDLPDSANSWIVNADAPESRAALRCKTLDGVLAVCVVGSDSVTRHWRSALEKSSFAEIHAYGLLPHANPRVVVPICSPVHAVLGLGLHRPGRRSARLVLSCARFLAGFGLFAPLRRRVLLIASRSAGGAVPVAALKARVSEHISQQVQDYAIYLGTPEENRKTVVLPLGASMPDTIVKSAASPSARRALLNEHRALSGMHDTALCTSLPLVKGIVEDQSGISLYLEYRARLPREAETPQSAVVNFLSELSRIERRERSLTHYLETAANLDQVQAGTKRWLSQRALKGISVCQHRGHGDFAPWNVSWTGSGLFVYDWEESRPALPAFWDCFYYVAAPALRIQKKPDPVLVAGQCIDFAGQLAFVSGLERLDIVCHFVLWCLDRIASDPFYRRLLAVTLVKAT